MNLEESVVVAALSVPGSVAGVVCPDDGAPQRRGGFRVVVVIAIAGRRGGMGERRTLEGSGVGGE